MCGFHVFLDMYVTLFFIRWRYINVSMILLNFGAYQSGFRGCVCISCTTRVLNVVRHDGVLARPSLSSEPEQIYKYKQYKFIVNRSGTWSFNSPTQHPLALTKRRGETYVLSTPESYAFGSNELVNSRRYVLISGWRKFGFYSLKIINFDDFFHMGDVCGSWLIVTIGDFVFRPKSVSASVNKSVDCQVSI